MILPAAQFPFAGYEVTQDEARGASGWLRSFDSRTRDYYFITMVVYVFDPTDTGATVVASFDCSTYADPEGRPVNTTVLTTEVVGDAAKACRHEVGAGALVYGYISASRNVVVQIEANPRATRTDAGAMGDVENVARLQMQIIDSLAPR